MCVRVRGRFALLFFVWERGCLSLPVCVSESLFGCDHVARPWISDVTLRGRQGRCRWLFMDCCRLADVRTMDKQSVSFSPWPSSSFAARDLPKKGRLLGACLHLKGTP